MTSLYLFIIFFMTYMVLIFAISPIQELFFLYHERDSRTPFASIAVIAILFIGNWTAVYLLCTQAVTHLGEITYHISASAISQSVIVGLCLYLLVVIAKMPRLKSPLAG